MTDEEIALEYEAVLAYQGEPLKTCPKCSTQTHEKGCPNCRTSEGASVPLTGDQAIDQMVMMAENNEYIEDLEALLRDGFKPVPREETP